MSNFTYLHLHTRFSRSGGPAAPDEWCRRAAELGYGAIGFTDRSPLAGLPSACKAAVDNSLKPLYGIEVDIALPVEAGRKTEPVFQPALVFARNHEGMNRLAAIASEVYSGWPGSEQALAWETLAANATGLLLILLGGDEAGALTPIVIAPAKRLAAWSKLVKTAFPDVAFVGIPHSGRPGDNALAGQVASAATTLDLPELATPTARYLRPEDAPSYEALKVARRRAGWPRDDLSSSSTASVAADRPGHDYLRSPEEASALYDQWPQAIETIARAVEMCSLTTGEWPLSSEASHANSTFLKELAQKRLLAALSVDDLPAGVHERLNVEIDSINRQQGAWAALATLADLAKGGRPGDGQVPIGAPTGSARGSLLAYALGISSVCPPTEQPITQNVAFPGLELPANSREGLISSLSSEYGPGRVARASCALPITPTQAVQAAGSVLGISGGDLKTTALATLEGSWDALSPEASQHDNIVHLASLALSLKGAPVTFLVDKDALLATPRQTHDTGTLASLGPLLSGGPVQWMPWSEEELLELGYPVFAVGATRALSLLDAAITLARRYPVPGFQAESIDFSTMPALSDAAANIVRKGELAGIPFLNHAATKAWTGELTLDGAAQQVARSLHLSRPPAPDSAPATWEELAATTGGTLLFTDQMLAFLRSSGLCAEEVFPTYCALLEPGTAEAEAAKLRFAQVSGVEDDAAASLWDALAAHAKLLVDRDAAAAWGRIALWLVAIKAAHPAAFFAAALSTATERATVKALAQDARRQDIKLESPNVSRSQANHILQRDGEGWAILWGLNHLPGWHGYDAARFLAVRPSEGFSSLREVALAAVDAGLSAAHIEALVNSGACDTLGTLGAPVRDRDAMLAALPDMLEWARAFRRNEGQLDLFSTAIADPPVEQDLLEANGQDAIHATHSPRLLYLRRLWEEANVGVAFTRSEEMDSLTGALEKSGGLRSRLITTAQIGANHLGSSVYLVGLLGLTRMIESDDTSGKEPLAVGRLEDAEGSIELVAFPPNYKRHAELWVEKSMVIVTGRVSRHDDGEIYLLSEHLAAFQGSAGHEAMTLNVKSTKPSRSANGADSSATAARATPTLHVPASPASQPVAARGALQPLPRHSPQPAPISGEPATFSLVISIPPADDDHTVIDSMIALNSLLNSHPGPDSVTLRVQYSPESGKWTSARLPVGVRFSHALESAIRRLLGDDALAVIKLVA